MGGEMRIRQAAVSGYFYPGRKEALVTMLDSLIEPHEEKIQARAVIVPHAGYQYSGRVAGAVYGKCVLPDTFIILCPNHTGLGRPLSLDVSDAWETPLGLARIDKELSQALLDACPYLEPDGLAHMREHALEVQIPFLQYLKEDFTFVPICVGTSRWSILTSLSEAIASVVSESNRDALLISSTDMTHYEPADIAEKQDKYAIERILELDARGLYDVVHDQSISMCGYLPTTVVVKASVALGASSCELILYTHSGVVTGDHSSVVAYAGFIIQ